MQLIKEIIEIEYNIANEKGVTLMQFNNKWDPVRECFVLTNHSTAFFLLFHTVLFDVKTVLLKRLPFKYILYNIKQNSIISINIPNILNMFL